MKNNVNNYTLHNEPLEQLHVVPEDDIKLKKIRYWCKTPGCFTNYFTGARATSSLIHFGSEVEWYELLVELIHSLQIQLNEDIGTDSYEYSIYVGFDTLKYLSQTSLFRLTADNDWSKAKIITKVGTLKNIKLYVDPTLDSIVKLINDNPNCYIEGEIILTV